MLIFEEFPHIKDGRTYAKLSINFEGSLKLAPDKNARNILYRIHIFKVWPSLNIALRQIQTDVCIERNST